VDETATPPWCLHQMAKGDRPAWREPAKDPPRRSVHPCQVGCDGRHTRASRKADPATCSSERIVDEAPLPVGTSMG
jgi:hypothetical protein